MKAAAIHAVLMLCAAGTLVFAQSTDSSAYDSLRLQVAAVDSAHPALQTADALAQAGLFADAIEILREHAMADPAPPSPGPHGSPRAAQWRISSGIDYYHLEDIDTDTMSADALREYERLTQTPVSVWLRAKSTLRPQAAFIGEISPEIYVSERKSRLSIGARSSVLGDLLLIEPSVKSEKWFRPGADDTASAPTWGQSSDMGGATMIVTATNAGGPLNASVIWSAPLSLDWEHYREDRPGYEAFAEYGFSPWIEIRSPESGLGARISAYGQYEDFYRAGADTLDAARFSGRAEGFGRTDKSSIRLSGSWMGERYPNAARLEAIDRIEGSGRAQYDYRPFLTGALRLRGIFEREYYALSSGSSAYDLRGTEISVEPSLQTAVGTHLTLTPSFLWEKRWAHDHDTKYLWEARWALEPGLRLGWSSAIVDAAVLGAFRAETIEGDFRQYADNSRSLRAGAEANVNVGRRVSINLFTDYQYRTYPQDERISENITISASTTLRL